MRREKERQTTPCQLDPTVSAMLPPLSRFKANTPLRCLLILSIESSLSLSLLYYYLPGANTIYMHEKEIVSGSTGTSIEKGPRR